MASRNSPAGNASGNAFGSTISDHSYKWMNSLRASSLTGMEEEREYGRSENMSLRRVIMLIQKTMSRTFNTSWGTTFLID